VALSTGDDLCHAPGAPCAQRESEALVRIVPYPLHVVLHRHAELQLTPRHAPTLLCRSATHHSAVLGAACARFLRRLRAVTGDPAVPLTPSKYATSDWATTCPECQIRVRSLYAAPQLDAVGEYPELGVDESYALNVTVAGVTIEAATPFGAAHALESLLQLIRPSQHAAGFAVPLCEIVDRPRFPWRGVMLDVVRHWMPLDVVMRTIDTASAAKFNVLHLHLTDDQGFRVFSDSYPELTEATTQDGEYFSQSDIEQIVRHAALRGVRVVPEFDMPAHSSSWILAMPQLAPEAHRLTQRMTEFGRVLPNMLDPSNNATWTVLNRFFDDMAALFPDRFWHVGGDEPNFAFWRESEQLRALLPSLKLSSVEQLFPYFAQRVRSLLHSRGKRMIMWEEGAADFAAPMGGFEHVPPPPISGVRAFADAFDAAIGAAPEPDTMRDVVCHNWLHSHIASTAVRRRQPVLMSRGLYMDFNRNVREQFSADVLGGAPEDIAVLGGECVFWSEWMTAENVEARMWPRAAAVAERLWSPTARQDIGSLLLRLPHFDGFMQLSGSLHAHNMRRMLLRLAGGRDEPALATLVSALQPLDLYPWHGQIDQTTPLIGLDNAVQGALSVDAELFNWRAGEVIANVSTLPLHAAHLQLAASRWLSMRTPLLQLADTYERSFLTEGVVEFTLHVTRVAFDLQRALAGLVDAQQPQCDGDFERAAQQHADMAERPHMRLRVSIAQAGRSLVTLYCQRPR
jgi:hexosaminidase